MLRRLLTPVLAALLLSGCLGVTTTETGGPPTAPATHPGDAEPFVVKGRVTTASGEPLVGAEVWADNTLAYNSNVLATTTAEGSYRIELPRQDVTTWRVGGNARLEYHGQRYEISLVGDQSPFGSAEGAVRDLRLVLTGPIPELAGSFYGATVAVHTDLDETQITDTDNLEVTLTPDGPLVDGSAGQVLTRRVTGGWQVQDVPIGRYNVTAKHHHPDGRIVDLVVRIRNSGNGYTSSLTAVIPPDADLEIEVQTP